MSTITRFAPSPTGDLHIGGARTALYSWLYARKMQGQFLLRIEDTDFERSRPEFVQAILQAMAWLNLSYDNIFYQSKNFARYQAVLQSLLLEGKAYRCYCSKERIEALRAEQTARKEKPRYDGHCRHQSSEQQGNYVVRFKNPESGAVEFEDLIRGKLSFNNAELDDLILARSDGVPTYNFTVVVDDWDMKITHVIRGDDHINNTPRQINIFRALNATPPHYAHLAMILGPDGKRLSKREGAASVMEYKEQGILPHALLNYLVRLGWSHGDQEIFSIDEMIHLFAIQDINKAAAALNPDKLLWLNQHYLKTTPVDELAQELLWHMNKLNIHTQQGPALVDVVMAQRERVKTLKEMAEKSRFFYEEVETQLELSADLKLSLTAVKDRLTQLTPWSKESIHQVLVEVADQYECKLGQLAQPIRIAVTGGTVSPPIDQTLCLLGQQKVLARLNHVLNNEQFIDKLL